MKVEHKHQLVTLAGLAANGGFQSIEASGIVNKAAKAFANDGAPVTDVMRERADKARAQMQVRTFHRMFHRMFHRIPEGRLPYRLPQLTGIVVDRPIEVADKQAETAQMYFYHTKNSRVYSAHVGAPAASF